jgi:uncharacterized protein YlxP (DUF503 family)
MYFVITRLTFDPNSISGQDGRSIGNLARKIRERFGVAISPNGDPARDGEAMLVIAAVGDREDKLSRTIDSIVKFCEEDGFGRIESENSFMEHIDSLDEE